MNAAPQAPAPRLAAPAPDRATDDVAGIEPGALESDRALHDLCEAWAQWARTRRFFGPPPLNGSLLGRLTTKTRPSRGGGPDADCSAELAALHLAIAAQPAEALDRRVFELHYVWRVRNIKAAARALGIGRRHWYTLLRDFRRRCHAAAGEIRFANAAAANELAQRRAGA